jgi:hypothetical protein
MANHATRPEFSPHWLGELHAWGVRKRHAASPRLVGLKTCLPRTRMTNLAAMAMKAASGGTQRISLRSSKESPRELMMAER